MLWAYEAGLYHTANPNGVLRRFELATMMYRFVTKTLGAQPDLTVLNKYPDNGSIPAGPHDRIAMAWAVQNGVFGGETNLRPMDNANRKDVAVVLWRFFERDGNAIP